MQKAWEKGGTNYGSTHEGFKAHYAANSSSNFISKGGDYVLVIDTNNILSALGLANDTTEEELVTIPYGMEKDTLELMMRVLSATHPEEIKDIETEQIIGLFDHITDVAPYIGKSNPFASGSFVKELGQIRPAKTRKRVL